MKNAERQKTLDEQKWLASEAKGCDQSGKMAWCDLCRFRLDDGCFATQEERTRVSLCATAYNRMIRAKIRLQRGDK